MKTIRRLIQLLTCALLLLAVAVNRNERILGISLARQHKHTRQQIETIDSNGQRIISTHPLSKDIWGFGGSVPLNIHVSEGKIDSIHALPNSESPEFFNKVISSGLLHSWDGLTPSEAFEKDVDGITGATLSSTAVIESVKRGFAYAIDADVSQVINNQQYSFKILLGLVVILGGMILPIFFKNKKYRNIQLVSNVLVLGFWCGTFLSLSSIVNILSNGIALGTSVATLLLILAAFVYPLFNKPNHYCSWICPLGSCQELIGKTVPYKIKLSNKTISLLTKFREWIWIVLMAVMWLGITFEVMNYELFTAFVFQQASMPIIILAVIVILLSGIIQRPYCRFICPTGTTLKFAQQSK